MVELLTLLQQNFAGAAREKWFVAHEEAKRRPIVDGSSNGPVLPKGF